MLALVSVPTQTSRGSARRGAWARVVGLELGIWAALYGTYLAVRDVAIASPAEAFSHAGNVVSLERTLGILHEHAVQDLLHPLQGFLSVYYMLGFGPVIAAVLVWLGLRDRAAYRGLRTALLVSISIATVIYVLFPTAPPRLVGGLAIEDTVGLSSHDSGSFLGIRFNPYAAVPSMHVGWSLIVALYAFRAARHRLLRAFFAVHPVLMAIAVTATGNHFFFDSAAGIAVALAALVLLHLRRRRKYPRLRAVPAPVDPAPPADGEETTYVPERRAA